jgi:hypothetical protein
MEKIDDNDKEYINGSLKSWIHHIYNHDINMFPSKRERRINKGWGKITYTFSANANEFPFRFRLTHPPRLLVPCKTEY